MPDEDKNIRSSLVLDFLNLMTSGENEHYSIRYHTITATVTIHSNVFLTCLTTLERNY